MLPPPLDRTTTHHPHALVHLVRLARKSNLVDLERRETVRRDLKVYLKRTRRSRHFCPDERNRDGQHTRRARRNSTHLEVQEPRSTQLPDECMFGMSQRSISTPNVRTCAQIATQHHSAPVLRVRTSTSLRCSRRSRRQIPHSR